MLNKHASVISKRVKKDIQPEWYNSEIMYARKMRDKYHSLGLWGEYKFWRNRTSKVIYDSKKQYYRNMVNDSKDPRILWKCIHSLNPSNPVKPYELLTERGTITTDQTQISNLFNTFFTSCVQNLRKNRSRSHQICNLDKLKDFVQQKLMSRDKFVIPPFNIHDLLTELNHLNVNKSAWSDNIGPKILKLCAPFIVSSLTYIFNRILDSGIFPDVLKNAKVSPIFKSGERCQPTNHRPISVLPTISKLMEKHVSTHLYKYLSKFQLLHPAQSGFRPVHSCQTALVNIVDKWLEAMNDGNLNVAVF